MSSNEINVTNISTLENELRDNFEYSVSIDVVLDLGINPRTINKAYAEEMPIETPAVILGIITDEEYYVTEKEEEIRLKDKLILIDGNHRFYSKKFIFESKNINAKIIKYKTLDDAKIDAYRFNVNHGRALSDREIAKGVSEAIKILRKREVKPNLFDIAAMLGLTQRQVRMYDYWIKVERALGEEIPKSKADLLNSFLKSEKMFPREEVLESIRLLKQFWQLNGHLKYVDLVAAKKHFNKTGEIVSYEHYKVEEMLSLDSFSILGPAKKEISETEIELSNRKEISNNENQALSEGDVSGLVAPEVDRIQQLDKEIKKDFRRTKFTLETLTMNFLGEIQEVIIDKSSSFAELLKDEMGRDPELRERLKKKESEIKGILANIKLKLESIESTLGLEN